MKRNCNHSYFQQIDTEEKAYWLGFLYADGSVSHSHDKKSRHEIKIELKESDRNHIVKFATTLNCDSNITTRTITKNNKLFKSSLLRFSSKDMVHDLIRHGCIPNKTHTLQWPNMSECLIPDFIRGYVDGDGSWSVRTEDNIFSISLCGTFDICSGTKNYLQSKLNLNNVKISKIKSIYQLRYSGRLQVLKIAHFLYDNKSVYLDRKKETVDKLFEIKRKEPTKIKRRKDISKEEENKIISLYNDGLACKHIKNIIKIDIGTMYKILKRNGVKLRMKR